MFNEVEGMMKRAISGDIDQNQLQQAAEQHVQSVDDQTLKQNAQQAAQNASQNGKPELAQQIESLLQQHGNDPQALKQGVIDLIKNNPEVLQHFEGGFAKNLLSRI
jgi:Asp-tRNA(Asn)/Glu-tRNA(Gln) amidotransferase B subunit